MTRAVTPEAGAAIVASHPPALQAARQALVFSLEGQRYALLLEQVQEIQHIVELSEVCSDDGPLVGVLNLRGAIVPAVDARSAIGLPRAEYTLETPMIVCLSRGESVALIVDRVHDVIDTPAERVQDPPLLRALGSRLAGAFATDDGLVYLLDADAMLGELAAVGD
ncbi:MAG: chemotaxis protein CheW [Coriobacteriia bacterium]|nr:chemotaxis protein CheW [Coriobacteriia bacterium]